MLQAKRRILKYNHRVCNTEQATGSTTKPFAKYQHDIPGTYSVKELRSGNCT